MGTWRKVAFLVSFLALAAIPGGAGDNAFEFFEEEAKVITASRRMQTITEAPVAVDVITAEEIRQFRAANIWEILRFRAGLDVIEGRSGDGQRALVSVRGFPTEYPQNIQLYIDGNSVLNHFDSIYWASLPVQLEDVERIEIIRGPNAALYGSGAGLGLINIITRKPVAINSASVALKGGTRQNLATHASWESGGVGYGWRMSHSYSGDTGLPAQEGIAWEDSYYFNKLNFRGWRELGQNVVSEIFLAGSWNQGQLTVPRLPGHLVFGFAGSSRQKYPAYQAMIKLSREWSPGSSWEIRIARNDGTVKIEPSAVWTDGPPDVTIRRYQEEGEALRRFEMAGGRLKSVMGLGYRHTVTYSDQAFEGHPKVSNNIRRVFLQETAAVTQDWNLIGAVSLENSGTGGSQPAYQAASVYSLSAAQALRASYSLSPTIPTPYLQRANWLVTPFTRIEGNPDYKSQKLESYELGYQTILLERRLKGGMNLFYMNIRNPDTNSFAVKSLSLSPLLLTVSYSDGNRAIVRGVETELHYKASSFALFANHTYEYIVDDLESVRVRLGTSKHKLNLGAQVALNSRWSANLRAGHTSPYSFFPIGGFTPQRFSAYWRLDAGVSYQIVPGWEAFIAGKNLSRSRHLEFVGGLEVPRMVFAGVNWNWSGSN